MGWGVPYRSGGLIRRGEAAGGVGVVGSWVVNNVRLAVAL